MKINYTHLLMKMHFFFFMGSVGGTFPFLHVYGKQIGISPLIIGTIAGILPILYLIARLIFGFIIDYFQAWRKTIFLTLLVIANSCYVIIFTLPPQPGIMLSKNHFQNISCVTLPYCDMEYHASAIKSCNGTKDTTCHWMCKDTNFSMQLSFHVDRKNEIFSPETTCLLEINETSFCQENIMHYNCNVTCDNFHDDQCLYTSITFWSFVMLMCFGEIGFSVFMSLSDAICLGILGEGKHLKYGKQRLWGSFGFGAAAFLTGYTVDLWSQGEIYKTYTPSILFATILTCIDLICCIKLKLSFKLKSKTILKDVFTLLKTKSIIIFLCFVTFLGILHSMMRSFLFWYLEDVAIETGYMGNIKLIEGLIVAAQTIGGEIIFFYLSGKILEKLGYSYTIIFCFICYALRYGLISLIPMPWWSVPIELIMHGPSYALCLSTIVVYGGKVTPTGTTATVQGLVQGLYDGFGTSVGNFIGGLLYKKFGGTMTLRIFSAFAAFSALMYFILHSLYLRKTTDTRGNIKWREPHDAQEHCVVADT